MINSDLNVPLNLSPRIIKQHKGKNSRFPANWTKMSFFVGVQPNNHFWKRRKNLKKKNIARVERALKGSLNSIPLKQHAYAHVCLSSTK